MGLLPLHAPLDFGLLAHEYWLVSDGVRLTVAGRPLSVRCRATQQPLDLPGVTGRMSLPTAELEGSSQVRRRPPAL